MKGARHRRTEFTSVSIPRQLFEKVERHVENTGFPSVSAYVAFVLRTILSESGNKRADYEASIVKKRLSELGYI